jgi:MFS family permease
MSFASASDWRDVSVASAARGLSMAGDFLAATALALALQSAGYGGLAVAGLSLAATLPIVLLSPLTGRLVDRVDSRPLLLVAGLVQATVCAVLAFVAHPVAMIGLVGLLACGLSVTQPAFAALLPSMVREDDLPKASAINQTAGMAGLLLGPALAGLLVGQFGVRVPLLLDAATYLAIVVAGLFLRTRRGGRPATTAAAVAAAGWRLRRDPLVLAMVLAVAGVVAGVAGVNVIDVFFIRETLEASPTAYGLVTAAWTGGMLAGSWILARYAKRWWQDDGGLVMGMLVMLAGACAAVLVGAAVPAAYLLVPLWLVGGAFNGGENVLSNVFLARRVPEQARGRAFAALNGTIQGAAIVGYLLGGLLLERFAPRPLMAVVAILGLVVVIVVAVPVARVARRERAAVAAPTPPPAPGVLTSAI